MKKFLFTLAALLMAGSAFATQSNPSDTTDRDGVKIIKSQVCDNSYYYRETCPDRPRDVKIDISKIGNKDGSSSSSNSKDNSKSTSGNGSSSGSSSNSGSNSSYGSNSGSSSSPSNKPSSGSDPTNKSENCQSTQCEQDKILNQPKSKND